MGDALPDDDFAAVKAKISAQLGRDGTEEEVMSSLMYEKVYSDYCDFTKENTDGVTALPSKCFWYGLEVGETAKLQLRASSAAAVMDIPLPAETAADSIVDVGIGLNRVGPLSTAQFRAVEF